MNKKILLLLPALALMLGACQGKVTPSGSSDDGSSGQTETVTGVELDHETLSLQVGNTSQLSASVKPISLSNREVNWSSDHPEFASVDASGVVTAVAAGVAHVRATADADPTKYAECIVTVTQRMVTVVMEDLDDILSATDTLKFGCYQGNNEKYYYFKGSVDSNTRGEVSDSWEEGVAVKLEAASTTGKYLMSFGTGDSKQYFEMSDDHHFAVVNTPTSGREWDWDATWHTVKRTISGTTYYPGTYQTFTTISGCNASQVADDFLFQFVYQVEPFGPESINLSIPQDALYVNDYVEVAAELLPLGAEGDLVWSVSGDEHVIIDQEGKLTADGDATVGGTVTVTATYGEGDDEVTATLNVSVEAALNYGTQAAPLSIDAATALLQKQSPSHKDMYVSGIATSNDAFGSKYSNWGDYIKLANDAGTVADAFSFYRAKAGENTGYETTYAEAGSMVGKRILAKGKGEIYSGKPQLSSGGVLLNIEDAGVEPASVTISPAGDFELVKGGSKQLSASVAPVTAPQTITWTSTPVDAAVAAHCSVVNGLVSLTDAAEAGEQFTIKATSAKAGVEATVVVTVVADAEPVPTIVNTPVANTKYKLGAKISAAADKDADVYLTGAKSSYYGATSATWAEGADFELIAVTGGYNVKVTLPDESVKYLGFSVSGDNTNIEFDDSASKVFTYDADAKTLFFTANGHTTSSKDGVYYFGSYTNKSGTTFDTISCSMASYIQGSNASKIDVSQFPVHFWALV